MGGADYLPQRKNNEVQVAHNTKISNEVLKN